MQSAPLAPGSIDPGSGSNAVGTRREATCLSGAFEAERRRFFVACATNDAGAEVAADNCWPAPLDAASARDVSVARVRITSDERALNTLHTDAAAAAFISALHAGHNLRAFSSCGCAACARAASVFFAVSGGYS